MEEKKEQDIIAKALEDMQMSLEPIRDKAMDQRARWTGFVECAELMLKAMANKAAAVKLEAQEQPEEEPSTKKEEEVITSQDNPEVSGEIDNNKWLNSVQKSEG
jgi:hypothetical protein